MTTSIMELWNQSHWLSDAMQVYAKAAFKSRWVEETKDKTPWIIRVKESAEKNVESGLEGMDAFTAALYEAAPKPSPNAGLLEEANKEILKHLQFGIYQGFGFDRTRTMDTKPVTIPKEAWTSSISFQSNKVKFQSLTFIDVRVRMVAANNDPLLHNHKDDQVPQVGRPSFRDPIQQAFHALLERGAIDLDAPLKSHWPKVRQQLVESGAGLPKPASEINDETFRRYLSNEIKRMKKTKKQ